MNKLASLILISATSAIPSEASEQVFMTKTSGVTFAEMCESSKSFPVLYDPCNAYIIGAVDALQLSGKTCIPLSLMEPAIITATVKKYLRERPDQWDKHALFIITAALEAKSQCKRRDQ